MSTYARSGLVDSVDKVGSKVLAVVNKIVDIDKDAFPYIVILSNLNITYYIKKGLYAKSDSVTKALEGLIKQYYAKRVKDRYYADLINGLSVVSYNKCQYSKSLDYALESYALRKELFPVHSENLLLSLRSIIINLVLLKDPRLQQYLDEFTDRVIKNIKHIHIFSDHERLIYLRSVKETAEGVYTIVLMNHPTDAAKQSFIRYLLNTTHYGAYMYSYKRKKLMELSSQKESEFAELQSLSQRFNKLLNQSNTKYKNEIDSLFTKIDLLERKLMGNIPDYPINEFTSIDVKNKLKTGEAIVIIHSLKYYGLIKHPEQPELNFVGPSDSVLYIFSKFSKDTVLFDFIKIPIKHQSKWVSEYYQSLNLPFSPKDHQYDRFAKPLLNRLGNIQNILLVNDNMYNKINLNAIYDPNKKAYLIDLYTFHPIISLPQWLKTEQNIYHSNKYACIFGNPDFKAQIVQAEVSKNKDSKEINQYRNMVISFLSDSTTKRTGIGELPESAKEVNQIKTLLEKHGYKTQTFTGKDASKINLMKVNSPLLLHIATHGFVLNDKDLANKTNYNPIMYAGLIMSGFQDSTNDAIINGFEAGMLPLSGTELVVLSACHTGDGKIENGEGIVGLQRSFKLAGAKHIVMSLWKAHDRTTRIIMEQFYKHWLSGKNYIEALKLAQLDVRKTNPNLLPREWGAWIIAE
jgi:CHAT domain-containing protein